MVNRSSDIDLAPPERPGRRSSPLRDAVLEVMDKFPGQWREVGRYSTKGSAKATASYLRGLFPDCRFGVGEVKKEGKGKGRGGGKMVSQWAVGCFYGVIDD